MSDRWVGLFDEVHGHVVVVTVEFTRLKNLVLFSL